MKKSLILIIAISFSMVAFTQSYDIAGGLRIGTELGITGKYRFAKRTCVEAIIQNGIVQDETSISILGEQHFPLMTRRLNMYMGGGLHKGWISTENSKYSNPAGITLIGGLDFTIRKLNVSWDFKPAINLTGGSKAIYSQSSVSVRYVFKQRETKFKKFLKEKKWQVWKKENWKRKKKTN